MDDEDDLIEQSEDTQYMQAQDPGYAIHLLNMELAHVAEERSKFSQADWDKLVKEDEAYFRKWDEVHGQEDENED